MNNVVMVWLLYIFTVVLAKAIAIGLVLLFIWLIYSGALVAISP